MHHQQLMEKELRLMDAKLKLQLGGDCKRVLSQQMGTRGGLLRPLWRCNC